MESNQKREYHAEFVVLSDTVRQRRGRTPNSSHQESDMKETSMQNIEQQSNVLPDLLPATFRLAETSALFSRISSDKPLPQGASNPKPINYQYNECSVVEIKEKNVSTKMSVKNIDTALWDTPQHGQIVDTINILETCNSFEPEFVETVHIVDASSDTDTSCPSPKTERKQIDAKPSIMMDTSTPKQQPLGERRQPSIDRQQLPGNTIFGSNHSSEVRNDDRINLKDLFTSKGWHTLDPSVYNFFCDERDSFYSSDKEIYDEPLVFSEDEDIPRYSIEMATDSDSDTVWFRIILI